MEFLVFGAIVLVALLILYGRSRSGGSVEDPDRARRGLPHDLREKNIHGASIDGMYAATRAPQPVSRESGGGKDGGG